MPIQLYPGCWSENIRAANPKWTCTDKYEDNPRIAYEFTDYKRLQYADKGGVAFAFAVKKDEWDEKDTRKQVMDRIQGKVLPGYIARKTGVDLRPGG